jgi:transposase-like protein
MKSETEQLAVDLAAERKAGGAKVTYSAELRRRVAAAYRRQGGGSMTPFAKALGVSPTAVMAWTKTAEAQTPAMVPVRVTKAKSRSDTPMPDGAGGITLTFRGVEIKLPASTSAAEIARLVAALGEVS